MLKYLLVYFYYLGCAYRDEQMSNLMAVEHQPATHLCEKYVNLVIGASNPLLFVECKQKITR